ncbi:MAG: ATP-binding protein [Gammaproteobacteria bacterium]|nr:ATP-binding protein [Gammaproteobacteria bacterium]
MKTIPYNSPIAPEALLNLASFSKRKDRSAPPLFAGRTDIIGDVEECLRNMESAAASSSCGVVVSGAPGSGKTSLIHYLSGQYDGSNVVPVRLSGEDLTHPHLVAAEILKAASVPANELGRMAQTKWGLGLGRTIAVERTNQVDTPSARLSRPESLWDVVSDMVHISPETTFLVLVDECQRVERDPNSRYNLIAAQMNDAKTGDLKVLPVFAGLSDTKVQLAAVGVSRTAAPSHALGPLSEGEAREVIAAFFSKDLFGLGDAVAPSYQAGIANTLVKASECYPRHLHCYLRGLAAELAKGSGDLDMDAVLDQGHQARLDYNFDRVESAKLGPFAKTLTDAAATMLTPFGELEADELVGFAARRQPRLEEDQARAAIDRAIHSGILEVSPHRPDSLRAPIPSMLTYLAVNRNAEAALQQMREACGQEPALKPGSSSSQTLP